MSYIHHHQKTGLYRSRDGILFGVCKGIADHFDISVFWTRVIVLVALICTGLWPVAGLYLLCALLMKPEPLYVPYYVE